METAVLCSLSCTCSAIDSTAAMSTSVKLAHTFLTTRISKRINDLLNLLERGQLSAACKVSRAQEDLQRFLKISLEIESKLETQIEARHDHPAAITQMDFEAARSEIWSRMARISAAQDSKELS